MILYTIVEKTVENNVETFNTLKFSNFNIRNKYFESYYLPRFNTANNQFVLIDIRYNNTMNIIQAVYEYNNIIKKLYLDELCCEDIYTNYTIDGVLKVV
jgi:hypothetical protein